MKLLVKKLRPLVELPRKAHADDAAFDLYADNGGLDAYWIEPGQVHRFDTGIAIKIPDGHYAQFVDRSGLAGKGIHVLGGCIDAAYTGELKVVLVNLSRERYRIERNDRIAQFVILPVPQIEVEEVSELPQTDRGPAGFGSTGR